MPHLVNIGVEVGGSGLRQPLERAEEPEVAGPVQRAVFAGVGDGVARESGLGIGLGGDSAAE